jgi:hypothetical protein
VIYFHPREVHSEAASAHVCWFILASANMVIIREVDLELQYTMDWLLGRVYSLPSSCLPGTTYHSHEVEGSIGLLEGLIGSTGKSDVVIAVGRPLGGF